jgi:hypothetical protein
MRIITLAYAHFNALCHVAFRGNSGSAQLDNTSGSTQVSAMFIIGSGGQPEAGARPDRLGKPVRSRSVCQMVHRGYNEGSGCTATGKTIHAYGKESHNGRQRRE